MPRSRVLVVEPNDLLRSALSRILEREGCAVCAVRDCAAAQAMVDAGDRPAAVLACCPGPGRCTLPPAERCGERPPLRGVPIVAMTFDGRTRCAAATTCLPKPFTVKALRAALRAAVPAA